VLLSHRRIGCLIAGAVAACALAASCGSDDDPLSPTVALSGQVSNLSGETGAIIVEIRHDLRNRADNGGRWMIFVHKDFYVDSLYAWVDANGNGLYDGGEAYGFYHSQNEPNKALSFRVRNTNVPQLNFTIP